MARVRITEYKAKQLVFKELGLPYRGVEVRGHDLSPLNKLDPTLLYVAKVDQGIKKRFKLGLVLLELSADKVKDSIHSLSSKGYSRFLIEPFQTHSATDERYISLERTRSGIRILTSLVGGVNIEEQKDSLREFVIPTNTASEVAKSIAVPLVFIEKLLSIMDLYHFSFLEINPLTVENGQVSLLDLAVEVDSAGVFFVKDAWNEADFVSAQKEKTTEEKKIDELSSQSQASFKLDLLNKDGSIFMLLSGGGASIVLADEVFDQGEGKELANYGEYSGNPNAEETYHYTKQILSLLIASKAKRKVLIIAGGVANFTDIRVTFKGIIQALEEVKDQLVEQNVQVFVRRGGPYQEEGLRVMKDFLQKENMYGFVSGPELVLTDIVSKALVEVTHA